MAAGVIVSRTLGPEKRGYMALVVQAATLIFAFGHLGLGSSITYYIGKKRFPRKNILGFTIIVSVVLGLFFTSIFYLVYPYIAGVWTDIPKEIMVLGLISVPFIFFNNFFKRFLLGSLQIKQANIFDLFRYISYIMLVIFLILIMKGGTREVVICFTVSMIITSVLGFIFFSKEARPPGGIRKDMVKPFFSYGSKLYLGFLFRELNNRIGIFIIKYYLSASEVSYYQLALNVSQRIWLIPVALTHVLFPTLLFMKKDSAGFTARVCRNNLFLMFVLSVLLLAFGKIAVVIVYGEQYARVATAIYSMLWSVTIWPVFNMLAIDFASRNQIWITVIISFIGAVVNISCNFIFISHLGMIGAGLATSVSNTVMVVLIIIFFIRRTGVSLREILIPTKDDFTSYRNSINRGMHLLKDKFRKSDESGSA